MTEEDNKKDSIKSNFKANVRREGQMLKITVPKKMSIFFDEGDFVEVNFIYRPTEEERLKIGMDKKEEEEI